MESQKRDYLDPDLRCYRSGGPTDRGLSRSRRRFLVASGYGMAHFALLGLIGRRGLTNSDPAQASVVAGPRVGPHGQPVVPGSLVDEISAALAPSMDDAAPAPPPGHIHDIVIRNGRVIDPGAGYDLVANVGIDNGVIVSLGVDPLEGTEVIDATNRVVAPGFIDLLSYEPNPFGVWYKLADGVTTNLAMHGIANYAPAFFSRYAGSSPIHFGGAYHHHFMRYTEAGLGVEQTPGGSQIKTLEDSLRENLAQGMAGVSFSPEYSSGTSTEEMVRLSTLVANLDQVAFFHVRHSDPDPPNTSLDAIVEVIEVARRSGASVHIEHITSTGGTHVMAEALDLIEGARSEGLDVTACCYPYTFWGTFLASARFAPGWQERYRIGYGDLQIAGTSQRLTEATFAQAQAENKLVAALGSIPEADVQAALAKPWMMVASDAILEAEMNNHPRAAGTFARTLGHYVRETGVLDLRAALAKMTIQPAQRAEKAIPALGRKGRLRRGADADIVVFDPATIADAATVEQPKQTSVGIDWVIVAGQVALRQGLAQRDVRAGQPLFGSAWDGPSPAASVSNDPASTQARWAYSGG